MEVICLHQSLSFAQQFTSVDPWRRDFASGQQRLCLWNNAASSIPSSNQAKAWSRRQGFRQREWFSGLRSASARQHSLRSTCKRGSSRLGWRCSNVRTASKVGKQREGRHPEEAAGLLARRGPGNFLLEAAVGGTTELLRLLGIGGRTSKILSGESTALTEDPPLSNLDEVLEALRKDYTEQAYFVTGNITDVLYDRDCYFADPTVNFTGRDKWKQNLKLLVPFLENPTITLLSMEPDDEQGKLVINTRWILRTYLKLPWRPYIDVLGGTTHTFNGQLQIVEHVERWSISSLDAIKQIFVPSQRAWQ